MNGSENGYACALFFTLISLGALIKLDGIECWTVSAITAVLAAISLRQAILKSAQEAEENHQRIEIQFRQLHSKLGEISSINFAEMNSLNDAVQFFQENLQTVRPNVVMPAQNHEDVRLIAEAVKKNSAALNAELAKEFEKLREIEDTNKENLQTVLKLLQIIGQLMKNPAYMKDLEKINSSIETLAAQLETALAMKNKFQK